MQSLAVDMTSLLLAVHVAMTSLLLAVHVAMTSLLLAVHVACAGSVMHTAKHYALSTAVQPAMTLCEASIDRQARWRTPHTNCATRERVKLADGANALPCTQDFCSVCRKSKWMEGHARHVRMHSYTACSWLPWAMQCNA
jgi:hypothetical protein